VWTGRDVALESRSSPEMDLASAYMLHPLVIIILYFRSVLPKHLESQHSSEVMMRTRGPDMRQRQRNLSQFIRWSLGKIQEGLYTKQQSQGQMNMYNRELHKERQGSDKWRNVHLRKLWQEWKEDDGRSWK
jgi:hypothetical protein